MEVTVSSEGHITAHDKDYSSHSPKRPDEKQRRIWEILNQMRCNIIHWFIATELTVAVESIRGQESTLERYKDKHGKIKYMKVNTKLC